MEDLPPPLEDVPCAMEKIKKHEQEKEEKKARRTETNFGGFQKGFFSSTSKKPKKASSTVSQINSNLPLIKPKSGKSNLVLSEVQKAMSEDFNTKSFQEDLSTKIESDPDISNVLSDPVWLSILNEFQSNAELAMKKYEENDVVKKTMLKLCSTFGESFLNMLPATSSDEDKLAKQLMESPQIKEALTNSFIVKMMKFQKEGRNDIVHRMMREANVQERAYIQLLIDHGLFTFR